MHDPNRIGGYLYNPMFRGYIHASWPFEPMKVEADDMDIHEVLDHITAAVESGQLKRDSWPEQLFASDDDLQLFINRLPDEYDDIFRIVDRWWFALSDLLNRPDEEEFITAGHIARAFEDEWFELKQRRESEAKAKAAKKAKGKKAAKA